MKKLNHKTLGNCLVAVGSLSLLAALPACGPTLLVGAGAGTVDVATQDRGIGGALSDTGIKANIDKLWLEKDSSLFSNVGIAVQNGQVLLTGSVPTKKARNEAERLAKQVEGVKKVFNEIQVGEPHSFGDASNDVWISTKVRANMVATQGLHSNNYSVTTFNGVVYLMGIAQNQQELNKAIQVARSVEGVRRVISHVALKTTPAPIK